MRVCVCKRGRVDALAASDSHFGRDAMLGVIMLGGLVREILYIYVK